MRKKAAWDDKKTLQGMIEKYGSKKVVADKLNVTQTYLSIVLRRHGLARAYCKPHEIQTGDMFTCKKFSVKMLKIRCIQRQKRAEAIFGDRLTQVGDIIDRDYTSIPQCRDCKQGMEIKEGMAA